MTFIIILSSAFEMLMFEYFVLHSRQAIYITSQSQWNMELWFNFVPGNFLTSLFSASTSLSKYLRNCARKSFSQCASAPLHIENLNLSPNDKSLFEK